MAGPFYNNIKGTTSGTPGTGAFTPDAASSGSLAWSTVPSGWVGLVRFEDGSSWELQYSYWNGTTLSRSATAQFVSSSSGSGLTLTSAATAEMVADANELQPHLSVPYLGWSFNCGTTSATLININSPPSTAGTVGSATLATTNYLTEQFARQQATSATTANAQAGYYYGAGVAVTNSTAGRGGWEFTTRFGASQLPTGPRAFIGMTTTGFNGNTGEPSALTANYAVIGKDSTDTNLQFLTNSNAGGGTKIDTGIALAANGWYEVSIWTQPGSTRVYMLLIRLDTGAIFYSSTTTDVPATGSLVQPNSIMGLSSTTGTALILHQGNILIRPVGI